MVLKLTLQPLSCPSYISVDRNVNSPSFKSSFAAAIYCNSQKSHCHSNPIDHSHQKPSKISEDPSSSSMSSGSSSCSCGRRRFLDAFGTAFLPISSSNGSELNSNGPTEVLQRIHPPRPDWYEELYAFVLNKCTRSYEAEIAGLKSKLFGNLVGKAESILEVGIGTGPNLKYYASENNLQVFGVDPNPKMEKYARAAAESVGLSPSKFKFMQGVAEALPVDDDSVDAVIGTLVLCSVEDVDLALQEVKRILRPGGMFLFIEHVAAEDETFRRFVQGILNPLQRTVADGCNLTRKTGKNISEAGFYSVDISTSFVSSALIVNPHLYGVAYK